MTFCREYSVDVGVVEIIEKTTTEKKQKTNMRLFCMNKVQEKYCIYL